MELLDDILRLRIKAYKVKRKLFDLIARNTAAKSPIMSDTPKGNGVKNSIEEYMIKKEKLEKRLDRLNAKIDSKWNELIPILEAAGATTSEQDVFKYRYYHGLKWRVCVLAMKKKYPDDNWNEPKAYRVHRKIMSKIDKEAA